jgi:Ca2+-binding RTX toxin-like protein
MSFALVVAGSVALAVDGFECGAGDDLLFGGEGDDHLDGQDLGPTGIGGRDVFDCGPGSDTFSADFDDRVLRNCEEGVVGGF